ncbi:MAG TPA: response regulator [Thermoanaerobaculia bacterium]|nr:response regulator [Thermoanaerobaculia bacterium]
MSRIEKPYILLVDDNEATCALMTALLQREFAIEIAGDGYAAIEQLKTRKYDAILLDLRMPQLDGFGVLDYLKEHSPETLKHVVIVSAALHDREVERLRNYDVFGVIRKPFEVELLLDAVKTCAGTTGGGFGKMLPMILLVADLLRQTHW